MSTDQRRFKRIPFEKPIQLIKTTDPDESFPGSLKDISLKGALVSLESNEHSIAVDDLLTLAIGPFQGDFDITLNVDVAYIGDGENTLGLNITSLDVESAAHLRRLIEVNLGDEVLIQRELSNLIQAMEDEHKL
jgi:hypothetical protein